MLALCIEALFGYPEALHARLRHPVVWIGAVIDALDRKLNRGAPLARRAKGFFALAALLAPCFALGAAMEAVLLPLPFGKLAVALLASSLIAQRSLHAHVADVARALDVSIYAARENLAKIVGRDTARLDDSAIARSAIESLAENFSDGVVAPVLWLALLGLPGALCYKAINTADSMIGHRTARHEDFGFAAAKLDDLVNLPASRLSAGLLAVATFSLARARQATKIVWRDARKHVSPNAGWPEAAMAGGLAIELGGPRAYHGEVMDGAVIGEGRRELGRADILAALSLYRRALFWLLAGVGLLASLG
ncbi:MAG TPA: adenosylcobinamide-phosphate synthase CbiB [Methylocystis sp.]|nr:adenosylcobinamide-phosphate synthase CbiB [Methylocystis sp.]